MTPVRLATKAVKESNYQVEFFIWDGSAYVVPVTARWTLIDRFGNVVNSRQDVELTPAEQMPIDLSGDDLTLEADYKSQARYVKVTGTMISPTAGVVPFVWQAVFEIEDTIDVTA